MSEFQFGASEAEVLGVAQAADAASIGLSQAIAEGKVKKFDKGGLRQFAAPLEPNTRFLVKAGKLLQFRDPNSPSGQRDVSRDGDIWAVFSNGICATKEPEVIEWCLSHSGDVELHQHYHEMSKTNIGECEADSGLCRDMDWPNTPAWAELKGMQVETSRSRRTLSPAQNVDRMFPRRAEIASMQGYSSGEALTQVAAANANADKQRVG